MTRHRIAQIGENRNPKSPENRPQTRRFLQIRLLQLRRSATPFNGLAVLHGRLESRAYRGSSQSNQSPEPACRSPRTYHRGQGRIAGATAKAKFVIEQRAPIQYAPVWFRRLRVSPDVGCG